MTLASSTITGAKCVGGIVGYLLYGTVSNCHVLSSVSILASSDNSHSHGGIVGRTYPNKKVSNATIENCTSAASVTDNGKGGCYYFGGIVGYNYYYSDTYFSTVTGCFYYGTAVSASSNAGAIVGHNYRPQGISNCYYNCPSTISGIGDDDQSGTTRVYKLTLGTGLTVSGITAYANGGLKRTVNDETTLYYGSGDQLSLTLANIATGAPEGYQYGYIASAGTLDGTTLTMPDEDVTISVDPENLVPLPIQRGDANADGSISVTDIAVVVNCILQLDNNGGFSEYGADANGDGQVTVTDIGVIVDKILGTSGNAASRRMPHDAIEPQ